MWNQFLKCMWNKFEVRCNIMITELWYDLCHDLGIYDFLWYLIPLLYMYFRWVLLLYVYTGNLCLAWSSSFNNSPPWKLSNLKDYKTNWMKTFDRVHRSATNLFSHPLYCNIKLHVVQRTVVRTVTLYSRAVMNGKHIHVHVDINSNSHESGNTFEKTPAWNNNVSNRLEELYCWQSDRYVGLDCNTKM